MHPHTLPQYLWAICSQNEAMCQAEVSGSIKPLYLISSGTIGLLWVLYTKPPLSLPSAMPDHITVGWTMVCEQSTIAYTPLAPYRIIVCPSWTEERSQSPVDMEHMPLLHQRALPIQVSQQPTLLPWSLCGALRMQHQGPPGPGEKVQENMGQWPTVAAPQMVVPIVPSLHELLEEHYLQQLHLPPQWHGLQPLCCRNLQPSGKC